MNHSLSGVRHLATLAAVALSVTAVAVLSGCNSSTATSAATTQVRAIHAVSDGPNVDIYVNRASIATNAPYEAATGFSTIASGDTTIQINPTGTTNPIIAVDTTLAAAQQYTAIAVGYATPSTPAEAITAVLVDDPGNAPMAGNVKVRVVHGAPAAPAVDVYVTAPGATLPQTPTVAALAYKSYAPAAGKNALEVPGGSYEIRVAVAGTSTIVFDSGSVALPANADLLVTAVPASGVSPIGLLVAPAGGKAFVISDSRAAVRVAHFSPNVPAVDVFLTSPGQANSMSNEVESSFAFPSASSYVNVPAGIYDASVALSPGTTGVLNLSNATLAANTSTSVFAIGLLGGTGTQQLQLAAFADDRKPVEGSAKVRVIHLAPDAPAVDVVALKDGAIAATLVQNLSYPNATAEDLVVAPGSYTVAVVPHGATSPILPTAAGVTLDLKAGQVVTAVAIGCLNTATGACAGGQPFALTTLSDN